MSVASPYPQNILLPQTAGPSGYPPETLFFPCPGNGTPWGAIHVRPVFLPILTCALSPRTQEKMKKIGNPGSYFFNCRTCNFRAFMGGRFWSQGVTREMIVRQCGPGIAVDDKNCYF